MVIAVAILSCDITTDPKEFLALLATTDTSEMSDIIAGQLDVHLKTQRFALLSSLMAVVFALCNTSLLMIYLRQEKKDNQQNKAIQATP